MSVDPAATPGPPLTREAETVVEVWRLFAWGAAGVFAVVLGLIMYCVIRYRRRDDRLPTQTRQNIPVEVFYTAVPLAIVIGLFAVTYVTTNDVNKVDAARPDVVVDVTGFQWNWEFAYPDLGVTVIGVEREPAVLVLPADSRVRFRATSVDVIHSFWIPGFRFKRDTIPGQTIEFDVDVLGRTGTFENAGACAEFCGLEHAFMRFTLRIVAHDEFERWAAEAAVERGSP